MQKVFSADHQVLEWLKNFTKHPLGSISQYSLEIGVHKYTEILYGAHLHTRNFTLVQQRSCEKSTTLWCRLEFEKGFHTCFMKIDILFDIW